MALVQVQWTSSSNGDWAQAADWAGGIIPGSGDIAEIEVANITVTVSTGTFVVGALQTSLSTFSVDGGTLTVDNAATIGGAFLESKGVLNLEGATSSFGTTASQSGGTLSVGGSFTAQAGFTEGGGTFDIVGNGAVFGGTLAQSSGLIDFTGGLFTSDAAFAQTGGELILGNSGLFYGTLEQTAGGLIDQTGGILTDDGSFAENGGVIQLDGGGAILNGAATIGSGTVAELTGNFVANDGLTMTGGALELGGNGATFYGTVTATAGTIQLGSGVINSNGLFIEDGGALSLGDLGGTFENLELESGEITSTAPTLQVNGTYTQTGGMLAVHGRDTTFAGPFSESTGSTIEILSGALQLEGVGSIAGTITGAGRLLIQGGTTTIASTAVLDQDGITVAGGTLIYAANTTLTQYFSLYQPSELNTRGVTLTLAAGAQLEGEVVAASVVNVTGGAFLNGLALDGTSRLLVNSTADQTGDISLGNATGSRTQLDIGAKGAMRITGNWDTFDQSQEGTISNAGSLVKTAGSGYALIETNFISTGQIGIDAGTLQFQGVSSTFGGTISGPGTFAIGGSGISTFSPKLSLTAARFILQANTEQLNLTNSIAYAGEWSQEGGTLWLDGSITVATSGETGLDGGLITGNGTFSTAQGAAVNISNDDIEGTATLDVAGTVAQTTNVGFGAQIGSAPIINIAGTSVWTIENNANLGGVVNDPFQENGIINNAGTFQELNGLDEPGLSIVAGYLNNTGSLIVDNGVLSLNGGGSIGGTISGNGTLAFSGGDYTFASTLVDSIGQINTTGAVVTLSQNLADAKSWGQSGGVLSLAGNTLTLSGATSLEGGSLTGPGTLTASGTTYIGDNYTIGSGTLAVTSHATQVGDITVGGLQAGALPPSQAALVVASGATYTLSDSTNIYDNGTLAVAGTFNANGAGASIIGPSVVDTGLINANAAALTFIGPVSGAGTIEIGAGGSLAFDGSVAAATTVKFNSSSSSMFLQDLFPGTNNLTFAAHVAGFGSGDFIEFSNLNPDLAQITLTLNGGATGTVATLTDQNGDSDSITFTSTQTLTSLSVGFGTHGDIGLFHS